MVVGFLHFPLYTTFTVVVIIDCTFGTRSEHQPFESTVMNIGHVFTFCVAETGRGGMDEVDVVLAVFMANGAVGGCWTPIAP